VPSLPRPRLKGLLGRFRPPDEGGKAVSAGRVDDMCRSSAVMDRVNGCMPSVTELVAPGNVGEASDPSSGKCDSDRAYSEEGLLFRML
jgi:hypothetical protein